MPERIHIYPVDRKMRSTHITRKDKQTGEPKPCWCEPELMQPCNEQDAHGKCQPDCWRCGGEGIAPVYTDDDQLQILIVHKDWQLTDA